MSGTDLVFRILGLNESAKVFTEVSASARETALAVKEADAEMARSGEETAAKREESAGGGMSASKLAGAGPVILGATAAAGLAVAEFVKMDGEFEKGITGLQTGAGETAKNLKTVSNGILDLAPAVGTTTKELISGMYMADSAGYKGAQGLTVLKAAAEGAKIGNADLGTETNALTDVLNDYHLPASKAVSVTDMLVKTVSSGKTTMEELGGSLSAVVPLASAAHISFAEVAGAEATMTAHGMSAQQSAQDLAGTIRSLQAPNQVAVKEMQALGLNSNDVSMSLGKKGLTGTLSELTGAITSHMGAAGTVLQNSFENSKEAAANAKEMISTMPPQLGKVAQSMLNGSLSSKQWSSDIRGLDPVQKHMMQQFAETAKQTHSFNSLLTSGGPAAQTYNAALEKMTGGASGLATSLLLTGENSEQFEGNVKAIGAAGQKAGKDVDGWGQVTNTLSFKLDSAKEVCETLGIKIGAALMPVVKDAVTGFTFLAKGVETGATWMTRHKTVAEALGIGIGVVLVPVLWAMASALVATAAGAIATAAPFAAVILIVAGLAYGIMELVHHWGAVEHAFTEGFDFVKDHWKEFVAAFLPGVGLLIVGVTEIVTHWKQIQHFLGDVWHETAHDFDAVFVMPFQVSWHMLKSWIGSEVQFVKTIFTKDIPGWWSEATGKFTSVFVTPVRGAIRFLEKDVEIDIQFFKTIFTKTIPGWLTTGEHLFTSVFITPVLAAVHLLDKGFHSAFNAVRGYVTSAFSNMVGIVRAPINGVIGLVDDAIGYLDGLHVSIPSWVPGVGGQSFGVNIPKIPALAAGGLVMPRDGGTTVTVAEAGAPEIVTPLPAMQQAMAAALRAAGSGGGAGSSADNPLYLRLELLMGGEMIDKALVVFQNRGGVLQSVRMAVA